MMRQERWHEALQLLAGAAQLVNEDYSLTWNQGWALMRCNDAVAATRAFERATMLDPKNQIGFWGLGLAQRESGHLAEAELSLLRAIALRESAPARLALANLYIQLGRSAEAEMIQREGVRLHPDYPRDGFLLRRGRGRTNETAALLLPPSPDPLVDPRTPLTREAVMPRALC
jgi:tetratricopeptide (TPR) repeat protein